MPEPKVLFVVTEDWYFWRHRLDLAKAIRDRGFEVVLATRLGEYAQRIKSENFRTIPVDFVRGARNPWSEVKTILRLVGIYKKENPSIVHHVALKPILYGSLAARFSRPVAVVNAFAGLGYVFNTDKWLARVLRYVIKKALRFSLKLPCSMVIFQNEHDRCRLVEDRVIGLDKTEVIAGSGVDIGRFAPTSEAPEPVTILLAGRMLWDKGVGEFVEAARFLKKDGVRAEFVLAGMLDAQNPAGIKEGQIALWQNEGLVRWLGHVENMPALLTSAHIVVLPSYHEGFPKILLEAAACAKPIVASDIAGCRGIVVPGINGFLTPPRNARKLAEALIPLVRDSALRDKMGIEGRRIVVDNFSVDRIAEQITQRYRRLLYR